MVGQEGIGEELDLIGVPHLGGPADNNKKINLSNDARVEHDPDVGAVVVGLDTNINYYKIQYAQLCLNQNPGCRFIATNLDAAAHVTAEQEWAAAGAMVGAIAGCTHQKPILVGKPSPLMIDYIAAKYGLEQRSRICMVGDRLDTDVLFGQRNGLQTILTLTGVTTKEKLFSPDNSIRPTYYADSVADLLQL